MILFGSWTSVNPSRVLSLCFLNSLSAFTICPPKAVENLGSVQRAQHLVPRLHHHNNSGTSVRRSLAVKESMVRTGSAKGKRKASALSVSGSDSPNGSASSSIDTPSWMKAERVRLLTETSQPRDDGKCVIYWMNRDRRAEDNWAMLFARHLAQEAGVPLVVAFVLGAWPVPEPKVTLRYAAFMIKGLEETEESLRNKRIPFHLLQSAEPADVVPSLAEKLDASAVVTDMSPLRNPKRWADEVADVLTKGGKTPLFQVDAHNVVPVWTTSDHQEHMARTIRPKIHARPDMFENFPDLSDNPKKTELPKPTDWKKAQNALDLDDSVPEVTLLKPGTKAASANLDAFISKRLKGFADLSNDPNEDVISHMSPYFNMGQMSTQAAAIRVRESKRHPDGVKAFIEQAVVRRELSDNYCFYNENYDNMAAAADWARDSLEAHANDPREWTYSLEELEGAKTHEDIWNAAQLQLVRDGKMHNFLRMYWAKKILEWSPSPLEALGRSIHLNDKYELDGRDPNGFTGCAWSVMGVHDMGWKEREIFGKIRYMNYGGCMRKFDVQKFVSKYKGAAAAAKAAGGTPATPKKQSVTSKKRKKA